MATKSSLATVIVTTFNEDIEDLKRFLKRELLTIKRSKYKITLNLIFESKEKFKFNKIKENFKAEQKSGFLKLLINQKGEGFSDCLNFGILNCDSKFIFRLDTDDISINKRYDYQIESMINYHYHLSYSDLVNKNNNKIIKSPTVRFLYLSLIFGINPIPHVSVCFDRKIFVENIGLYNNQLSKSEDFEYWVRYILKFGTKKIFKEKEPMTVYNVKGAFIKSRESAISQIYIRFKFFKQHLLSIILLGGIFPNLIRIIFPKLIIKFKYFITSKKS